MENLRIFLQLARFRISVMVTASAMAGFGMHSGLFSEQLLLLIPGVFLLVSGASALNQVQEKDLDARMERTRNRPLPCGRISPLTGMAIALVMIASGLGMLSLGGEPEVSAAGILALLCYNGVYTPLKRHTSLALLPGALCGAVPPLMGWMAAGGSAADPRILLVAGFFFLWQIPHFVLFSLSRREDYERSGLPHPCRTFRAPQLRRILTVWLISLAFAGAILPFPLAQGQSALPLIRAAIIAGLCFEISFRLFRGMPSFEKLYFRMNLVLALVGVSLLAGGTSF